MSTTILIVEDAAEMMALMAGALTEHGFAVIRARSVVELRQHLVWARPDLILLDINLPDGDGLELACNLRLRDRAGLIFVTGRDDEADRLRGLELGGDDYLTKPINVRELVARINNVLRRRQPATATLRLDGWLLDPMRRELFRPDGTLVTLTTGEFNILAALAAVRPQPLGRDFLLDVISNRDPRTVNPHTVDTLIGRLRRKLQDDQGRGLVISTIRGAGYALPLADAGGD